ncbi:GntR family transcriptional regulator [Streptomyces sp. NPDC007100]|uniref:GntR family transcriptional regulator n=1 Tax=Streptomyces sp. NPDC007100 TaxID=3155602 RepID=UPI0033F24367
MPGSKPGVGYKQIADDLRARIERGDLQPGDRFPSESEVMAEFKAGRETVSKALRALQDAGLIVRRKGAATRVREFAPIRRSANKRLSKSTWGAGLSMWSLDVRDVPLDVTDLRVSRVEASAKVAEALDISRGAPVVKRRRSYVLDGKVVLIAESHIPADLADGTPIAEEDTGPGGIYQRLADIGHGPERFKEELRARMPTKAEAVQLELLPGTPVICAIRTAIAADGRVVEINDMRLDAGSFIMDYVIDA